MGAVPPPVICSGKIYDGQHFLNILKESFSGSSHYKKNQRSKKQSNIYKLTELDNYEQFEEKNYRKYGYINL